jgi:hypothetical protein
MANKVTSCRKMQAKVKKIHKKFILPVAAADKIECYASLFE